MLTPRRLPARRLHSSPEVLESRIAPAGVTTINVNTINGPNGFSITGAAAGDQLGSSVAGAGDVNGDGNEDFIVGAVQADANGTNSGAAYVVFGPLNGSPATLAPGSLDGTNGFRIRGASASDLLGVSVNAAGDVNNDGLDDVIVFASRADIIGGASGSAYVVFGKATGFTADFDVTTLDGTNGFRLDGPSVPATSNFSAGRGGDLNGDGFAEVVMGIESAGGAGAAYVVFGKATGFAATLTATALGSDGFTITGGLAGDLLGRAVNVVGDVNGDGRADLLVTAPGADNNGTNSGSGYVIFGQAAFGASLDVTTLDGTNGFRLDGAAGTPLGITGAGAGDVNGDGFDDVIFGATNSAAVVFGKTGSFAASFAATTLTGANGFLLSGAGNVVSTAGDMNLDGFDDVIVATNSANAYVVYGRAAFGAPLNVTTALDGSNGFRIIGTGTNTGLVGGGFDLNDDGFDDVAFGRPFFDITGGTDIGQTHILYGFPPSLQVNDVTVTETNAGSTNATFTVLLSTPHLRPITVEVATADSTALAGSDYLAVPTTLLTFAPGETSKTVTVTVLGDVTFEANEAYTVNLANPVNTTLFDAQGTGTINNNDPQPALAASDVSVAEGALGALTEVFFTVASPNPSSTVFSVSYAVTSGSATSGVDFTVDAGSTLTFQPGETSKTVRVVVSGDVTFEGDETFTLTLSNPSGATVADASATGTILEDDPVPAISVANLSLAEGGPGISFATFNVTLANPSKFPVTATYATLDGTAVAPINYQAIFSGEFVFAPGETSKTVQVPVFGNAVDDDDKAFGLQITSISGGTIAQGTGLATILDDDAAPTLSIDDVTVVEGNNGVAQAVFTVRLSAASGRVVSVGATTYDGTASAPGDYTVVDGTVTFQPGETSRVVTVTVQGDALFEVDETFLVLLGGAVNAGITDGSGLGTILDFDAAPAVSIGDVTLAETAMGTTAVFTITLSAPSGRDVAVTVNTADLDAVAGEDYVAVTNIGVTIPAGATTGTIGVIILGDTLPEFAENFFVELSDAANATIASGAALGTILNDDVTLVNRRTAKFTDLDGDTVIVKTTAGAFRPADFVLEPGGDVGGAALVRLDLNARASFAGATLTITANRGLFGGTGFTRVERIEALLVDLAAVTVDGSLGGIDAGDLNFGTPGIGTLTAQRLGSEPGDPARADSLLFGGAATIAIQRSVIGANLFASGNRAKFGTVQIGGDLFDSALVIEGQSRPLVQSSAVVLTALNVGGDVAGSQILAGYDDLFAPLNGAVAIGSVTVGGNWIASDLAAGVDPGADGAFGSADDTLLSSAPGIISRIARISIAGAIIPNAPGGQNGFVAHRIGSLSAGGNAAVLTPGLDVIDLATGVTLREI